MLLILPHWRHIYIGCLEMPMLNILLFCIFDHDLIVDERLYLKIAIVILIYQASIHNFLFIFSFFAVFVPVNLTFSL